jgi:Mg-chelatase subunit ChlD
MTSNITSRRTANRRHGAILVLIAMLMVVFLMVAAFTIDIAYMQMVRTQLRTSTDAAARAGAGELSRGGDELSATKVAKEIAKQNNVAGAPLLLRSSDIAFGTAKFRTNGATRFVAGGQPLNALQVDGSRTGASKSGAVRLWFGKVFGVENFEPTQTAVAARLDRDISLVLDHSGSMNSYGRWDALGEAVDVFLLELDKTPQTEQLSLVGYSTNATLAQPLTKNLNDIRTAFGQMSPGGWTAIGLGLEKGSDSLEDPALARAYASKTIIVMTDGNQNTGPSPAVTVQTAVSRNQTVHTITFSQGANQTLMSNVAQAGGGVHLHAPDKKALKKAFKEIANRLPIVLAK